MQNKANLPDIQMNVSSVKTKDYENKRLCRRGEKQTQSNPNKLEAKRRSPTGELLRILKPGTNQTQFQTSPCKSASSRGLFIWIKHLLVTLDFDKAYISSNQ